MKKGRIRRGFTLIELMVVVVILGILATIAMASYKRYLISSRIAEAEGLITKIKMLQESYFANFGRYANVSNTVDSWEPNECGSLGGCRRIPGNEPLLWNRQSVDPDWGLLGFAPMNPIYFQLNLIAGMPGTNPPALVMGNADLSAYVDPSNHWYIVRARGDGDEDTVYSWVASTNSIEGVLIVNSNE